MDIRNFFGKKGVGSSSSSSSAANKPKTNHSISNRSTTKRTNGNKTTTKTKRGTEGNNNNNNNNNSKNQALSSSSSWMVKDSKHSKKDPNDSDVTTDNDDAEFRSNCMKKQQQQQSGKRKHSTVVVSSTTKVVVDLEATTDDEEDDSNPPKQQQKQTSRSKKQQSTTTSTPPSNKRKLRQRKRIVIEDSDDDTTGGSDNDDDEDFKMDHDNHSKSENDDDDDESNDFMDDDEESNTRSPVAASKKQSNRKKTRSSSSIHVPTTAKTTTATAAAVPNKKRKTATTTTKTANLKKSKGNNDDNSKIKQEKTNSSSSSSSSIRIKVEDLDPSSLVESYPVDSVQTTNCLEGLCFVFSGVLPNISREESEDYIKILGGRVTKAVSGKTNYLVCGETLEDGRNYKEGSKYRKAKELGDSKVTILLGSTQLYSLVRCIDQKKSANNNNNDPSVNPLTPSKVVSNPYAKKKSPISNPYASKSPVNNPYAKSPKSNPYKNNNNNNNNNTSKHISGGGRANISDPNALWTDKYAPSSTHQILGNQESVRKLSAWLERWEDIFNNPRMKKRSPGAPGGPFKAALLSGPPGIGKTTTATLVAKQTGRTVLELNASDTRSKKSLVEGLGDVTGSQVLSFAPKTKNRNKQSKEKRCIIMDEVDGMGAGDRSGMSELIKMIKESKVPIICICNDRQSQKIRSLAPYCLDLKYRRPVKTVIARRAVEIGAMEGLKVEPNAAEAIAESCGNDIRQVVNCLQMWASKNRKQEKSGQGTKDMTYKALKERQNFINKDEILRVSMFDATKLIVEGPKGLGSDDPKTATDSLYKRCDAFFTDYSLMGLNVHQNYLKVMVSQFQENKRKNDEDAELECLERMHAATSTMSDFAMAEHSVRGGDQNWALLPFCSVLAVKTGYHIAGPTGSFLPGFPQFAGWLGKNSSRSKMMRLLKELNHHMNYQVSSDTTELRLLYLPVLRDFFMNLMVGEDGPKTGKVIDMMDEYGLDRDDLFENIDEFTLESKPKKFSDLESKVKAAFTREYNKRAHKSQALVEEQGISKTRKKKSNASTSPKSGELDVVDDDAKLNDDDDEDDDDEFDEKALTELFKSKGRGSKAKSKAKSSRGKNKKK